MKKIALVTGANKGLGFETAKQLAGHDIKVLIGTRDHTAGNKACDELKEINLDVDFLQVDVSNEESIIKAKEEVEKSFGRLDILVNNAGIMLDLGIALEEVTSDVMKSTFDVNVVGPMLMVKHFLPLLQKSEAGRIVNVSSGLGSLAQSADANYVYYPYKLLVYNSSKAALNSMTLSYAFRLKDTNIKINSADPGFCKTDLNGNIGPKSPEDGAKITVGLATLDDDGPHGGFFDLNGIVPW
ncbi:MAG: SDR family oxidoreductase [Cyclobacteriaceae bacterium]|nr:SDR family oxidoreductase [Cyclobacteriaceae bacterium HetDA_MAG_MS6]